MKALAVFVAVLLIALIAISGLLLFAVDGHEGLGLIALMASLAIGIGWQFQVEEPVLPWLRDKWRATRNPE